MSQRGQLALTDAAERMIVMADIARRHPDWRVVFTGGSAAAVPWTPSRSLSSHT